jgi:hypothetical protein
MAVGELMNWKRTPAHPLRRDYDNMTLMVRIFTSKPFWMVAAAIVVALGFDFKTPAAHFKEIETRAQGIDIQMAILRTRQDSVEATQNELRRYIRALAIAQCLDRPARDTRLMGLPCDELIRNGNR